MTTDVSTNTSTPPLSKLQVAAKQITEFNRTSNPGTAAVIRLDLGVQFLSLGFDAGEQVSAEKLLKAISENLAEFVKVVGEDCLSDVAVEDLRSE